jgi:hypothetical protein
MRIGKRFIFLIASLLAAPSLAGTIDVSPGQNLGSAISDATSGETVLLGSGTFTVTSPITVPSGVTVTGVSCNSSHVVFNLPGNSNSTYYGFQIAANASNTTIEQLDLHSNHGVIQLGAGNAATQSYKNVVITNNNLQYGAGNLSDGTLVYGISVTMSNNGLQITHNYFHDSPSANRNWCIFSASNANLDYNLFYNIEDGGQLMYPGPNVSMSHNYGTMIHRMGQEGATTSSSSVTFNGNVFYNWATPYQDSDAISFVGTSSGQVNYTNNYFGATIAPGSGWGPADSSGLHRFGFAIEGNGHPEDVSGNIFVGTWACEVCSVSTNTNVYDNAVYGGAMWGEYTGEAGGTVTATGNATYSVNSAPNPPANTFAGPNPSSTTSSSSSTSPPVTKSITPASGGSISGVESSGASSYNLTSLGTSDWAHWGRGGSYGNFDHKASGDSQISNVTVVGSGDHGAYTYATRTVSWTGGTPTSADSADHGYLWANNAIGAGYSFTVPASTSTHTVYLYLGGYSSGSSLTAQLSDGSAANYTATLSSAGSYANVIAITFKAGSAGQSLKLTYVKSENVNGSSGSADLIAAWLQ